MENKHKNFCKLIKRIYYHDTDCGGVVYYANYLKYLEESRTEYFLQKNIILNKLSEEGLLFLVKKVEIDYKAPAYYLDQIEIYTQISKIKSASLEFFQEIKKKEKILVVAKTILVCVNKEFRPTLIPQNIINVLSDL
ncbi:MAG: acyl-CoA thioesterase [Candidatus Omnitrophica bacterium]|nr:acyl-CoA thioesterase [Candidatus Omnitrophota bacterium]